MCVYSNSRNDVTRVAQRYGTIAALTRRRASVLVVFVVFCVHMYSFACLILGGRQRRCSVTLQSLTATLIPLFSHLGMFVTTGCSSRRQFVATASRQDTGSRQQNTDSGRQVTASGQFYKPSQTQESKYSSYALLLLCRLKWKNGSTFNERNFM